MEVNSSTDFVTKFHNLDGNLISERKKNFYYLLKNASENLNTDDIDNAIENFKPTTYQEKWFFVETLVYFKKVELLIEVLKKCNKGHIKVVVKQKWFIQEAFKDITPSALVNEFFPCVSYSTQLKLLERIPNYWPEEKNDELFDCIQKRYGFIRALQCLHTCSELKIETHLKEHAAKLSTKQIIFLLNRSKKLFKLYLHTHYGVKNPYNENNVLNLLARKSTRLLLELINNKEVNVKKLSVTASVMLINIAKKKLFNDPHFYEMFNTRTLVKNIGSDIKTFLEYKCPQNIEELNSQSLYLNLLNYYPENLRWKLFTDVYHNVYPNKTIDEFLKVTDTFIITLYPDKEIIFKWAEFKYKATDEDTYLMYFSPSVSIPILKDKINVTSDAKKRHELLKLLISTCATNKDLESLDTVLECISHRHKNDPFAYKRCIDFFLEKFKTIGLTKNQWNFVHQQIIFIKTHGLIHFYYYEDIVVELLKYSYENDKDLFKILITDYLKDVYASKIWGHDNFGLHFGKYKFKFEIFIELCNLFSVVICNDNEYFWEILSVFILTIVHLSKEFPDRCINMLEYPIFVTGIQEVCDKPNNLSYTDIVIISLGIQYSLSFPQYALPFLNKTTVVKFLSIANKGNQLVYIQDLVVEIVKKKQLSELESTIISFLLESTNTSNVLDRSLVELLQNHPLLLLPSIAKNWSNIELKYIKMFKQFSHLSLDKILCEYLAEKWSQADLPEKKKMIKFLLNLLSEEDFTNFFVENINLLTSVTELSTEDIQSYGVQSKLAGDFKEVSEPSKYLPLLEKFCTETYITFALPSLYSFFARLQEESIYAYIESMSIKNETLKKCSIFLSCAFLKQDYVVNLLRNTLPDDHVFLRSVCLVTLTYFRNTYNEELFPHVIKYISMIITYDKRLFSKLVKCIIPKRYRPQYIEICWRTIVGVRSLSHKVNTFLDNLLKHTFAEDVVTCLSTAFVNKVICDYLPIEGAERLTNIDKFTILCLAYRESERVSNHLLVFDILSKSKEKSINTFCKTTVDCYCINDVNLEFMNDFIKHWNDKFSLVETLNEHITLQLFQKNVNKIEEIQAKNIIEYLHELLTKLGPRVFEVFVDNLQNYFNYMDDDLLKYKLLYLMLNYKISSTTCVLILKLLKPVYHQLNKEVQDVFKEIIEKIKTVEEPIVASYYEMYLQNL